MNEWGLERAGLPKVSVGERANSETLVKEFTKIDYQDSSMFSMPNQA